MYILGSGLDDGDEGDDSKVNACGVTQKHSFPVIKFLNLTAENENFHLMYLVRDPRGNFSHVDYNQKWNKNDPDWTENLL